MIKMENKLALVTGAAGGMGRVIAKDLAMRGFGVVVVCRSIEQASELSKALIAETSNTAIFPMAADLARLDIVRELAQEFIQKFGPLNVLVNNAGAHFLERRVSEDGFEMHFAVNHLGPFLLTNLLLGALIAAAPSRIINVTSASISDTRSFPLGALRPALLDLNDLQAERSFHPMEAYAKSKLANLMCGYVLARNLASSGVVVHALHPGIVATSIIGDVVPAFLTPALGLIRFFLRTPEEGAAGAIDLATRRAIVPATGGYFVDGRPLRSPQQSYDLTAQASIWKISRRLVGIDRDAPEGSKSERMS